VAFRSAPRGCPSCLPRAGSCPLPAPPGDAQRCAADLWAASGHLPWAKTFERKPQKASEFQKFIFKPHYHATCARSDGQMRPHVILITWCQAFVVALQSPERRKRHSSGGLYGDTCLLRAKQKNRKASRWSCCFATRGAEGELCRGSLPAPRSRGGSVRSCHGAAGRLCCRWIQHCSASDDLPHRDAPGCSPGVGWLPAGSGRTPQAMPPARALLAPGRSTGSRGQKAPLLPKHKLNAGSSLLSINVLSLLGNYTMINLYFS